MRRSVQGQQWALRILCAVALLLVGFAHQPPVAAGPLPLDLSAYALPDGTLPVFCVTATDGEQGSGQKDKHAHATGCEACRIGSGTLLPMPADAVGRTMVRADVIQTRQLDEIAPRRVFRHGAAPRAPPSVIVLT